jgi:hypothetical protein
MSRRIMAGLCVALALTVASPASAQLGGLVKKAKDKAAATAGVQQPSTDQPARMPGPVVTKDVVDHLLIGLKAEKAARDNWAANEGKRQEAAERRRKAKEERDKQEALARMDPQARHQYCISEAMQADPEYAKLQKLGEDASAASKKNDNNAAMQIAMQMAPLQAALQQRADSACTAQEKKAKKGGGPSANAEQQAIQDASPDSPEDAGAQAGGFSATDYAQLKELILIYLRDPKRAGLADGEKPPIETKRAQLQDGLKSIGMM